MFSTNGVEQLFVHSTKMNLDPDFTLYKKLTKNGS